MVRRLRFLLLVPLALSCGAGCLGGPSRKAEVEKKIMASKSPEERHQAVIESYQPACPDVVHITVAGLPDLSGDYAIGADGRVQLGQYGAVRIEGVGRTEIARRIGLAVGVPAHRVLVQVVEYNSQYVILMGEVAGSQKVHAYHGQETVLELLHRTGGITRGAAPESIYVVRSHIENGQRPEVFHIDLAAILDRKDDSTNILVLPCDQIHVGETRQSKVETILPPWLRPLYQDLWGTRPEVPEAKEPPPRTPRPRWFHLFPWNSAQEASPTPREPDVSGFGGAVP